MDSLNRLTLGIWDGHDAGAALCVDGSLVAAASEERFTRIKKQAGFPHRSIRAVLEIAAARAADVQQVALTGTTGRLPARLLERRYANRPPQGEDPRHWPARAYAHYQNRVAPWPLLASLERAGSTWVVSQRLARLGVHAPLRLFDHHRCHALTAVSALTVGAGTDALIVTMDGYGDGVSCAVWRWHARDRRLQQLARQGVESSLALLYGGLNAELGFAPGEEGKVTGLAAAGHGHPNDLLALGDLISAREGEIVVDRLGALARLRAALRDGCDRRLIAQSLQVSLERAVVAVVRHWLQHTGLKRLAVAGGLFANVSVNGKLAALQLDELAIFGAMGDGGLCAGAAFAASLPHRPRSTTLRLGPEPQTAAGREVAPAEIAEALAGGALVAVCRGPMEFGPRALGGRSLLFDPRSLAVAEQLGRALGRPPFMPFAPLIQACHWSRLFDIPLARVPRSATEMTIALPMVEPRALPAATAGDGSARPQVVDEGTDPWLLQLLEAFEALTGCVGLVNTSLNSHRRPISMTTEDCMGAAVHAGADLLVVQDRVVAIGPDQADHVER